MSDCLSDMNYLFVIIPLDYYIAMDLQNIKQTNKGIVSLPENTDIW